MSDQDDAIHQEAIKLIRESGLDKITKIDLYELYLEECEDTSVATAMDRLVSDVKDAQEKQNKQGGN